ncbi:MAG: IniB N-terminal domain-containing protein [Actinomycetota bacterium]|nr:IniB N-terminal domain-containing protein [Actinomycetota bacterium]
MTNVATTLLDFILNLLNDPEAMAAYQADREGALTAAGLGGCGDEVDAALTSAGAGHSLYYAPATFHHSDWSDDRDVVFVKKYSDDDGIDDSFNTIANESFNDNIVNSFNTTTNTTINDNDFTNNGVIIDGNGNTVDNTVRDDDTTITNVNSNNTTVEGDVVEGDVIEEAGPGSVVVGDQSTGDVEDSIVDNDDVTQSGLVNVNDVLSPNLNVAPDVEVDVL